MALTALALLTWTFAEREERREKREKRKEKEPCSALLSRLLSRMLLMPTLPSLEPLEKCCIGNPGLRRNIPEMAPDPVKSPSASPVLCASASAFAFTFPCPGGS